LWPESSWWQAARSFGLSGDQQCISVVAFYSARTTLQEARKKMLETNQKKMTLSWVIALSAGLAALVCLAPTARAELAWHLDQIGYDEAAADPRFSSLLADGGSGQAIAVFDEGIWTGHDSFAGRNVSGRNFVANNPNNWDLTDQHGTGVASIAAGNSDQTSNSTEVGGVARGTDIVSVRVLGSDGTGTFGDIYDGMDWVIDQVQNHGSKIEAIKMSVGGGAYTTDPQWSAFNSRAQTLENLGVPIFAASGNDGFDDKIDIPSISKHAIAVGSSSFDDSIANHSNRNSELDLLAPGVNIWWADASGSSDYSRAIGTSLATPQAAGAALLIDKLFEQRTGREPTVSEIEALVTTSDTIITEGSNSFPRLDLMAALEATYDVPEPGSLVVLFIGSSLLITRRRAGAKQSAL
jgi:major intracellular serine protease